MLWHLWKLTHFDKRIAKIINRIRLHNLADYITSYKPFLCTLILIEDKILHILVFGISKVDITSESMSSENWKVVLPTVIYHICMKNLYANTTISFDCVYTIYFSWKIEWRKLKQKKNHKYVYESYCNIFDEDCRLQIGICVCEEDWRFNYNF